MSTERELTDRAVTRIFADTKRKYIVVVPSAKKALGFWARIRSTYVYPVIMPHMSNASIGAALGKFNQGPEPVMLIINGQQSLINWRVYLNNTDLICLFETTEEEAEAMRMRVFGDGYSLINNVLERFPVKYERRNAERTDKDITNVE